MRAPAFRLQDPNGERHTLERYRDKRAALYFRHHFDVKPEGHSTIVIADPKALRAKQQGG